MSDEKDDGSNDPNVENSMPIFRPLDYRLPGTEQYQPKTPFGIQVLAGFIAWIAWLVFVVRSRTGYNWGAPLITEQDAVEWAPACASIAVGALAIWLRLRFHWRGFVAGLMLGFGLTCLVPIGIFLIICSFHG